MTRRARIHEDDLARIVRAIRGTGLEIHSVTLDPEGNVTVALVAVGLAAYEAWLQWTTSRLPDETLRWQDGSVSVVRSFNYHPADLTMAGLGLVLALVLYAAARAVGWVLDGFMKADKR